MPRVRPNFRAKLQTYETEKADLTDEPHNQTKSRFFKELIRLIYLNQLTVQRLTQEIIAPTNGKGDQNDERKKLFHQGGIGESPSPNSQAGHLIHQLYSELGADISNEDLKDLVTLQTTPRQKPSIDSQEFQSNIYKKWLALPYTTQKHHLEHELKGLLFRDPSNKAMKYGLINAYANNEIAGATLSYIANAKTDTTLPEKLLNDALETIIKNAPEYLGEFVEALHKEPLKNDSSGLPLDHNAILVSLALEKFQLLQKIPTLNAEPRNEQGAKKNEDDRDDAFKIFRAITSNLELAYQAVCKQYRDTGKTPEIFWHLSAAAQEAIHLRLIKESAPGNAAAAILTKLNDRALAKKPTLSNAAALKEEIKKLLLGEGTLAPGSKAYLLANLSPLVNKEEALEIINNYLKTYPSEAKRLFFHKLRREIEQRGLSDELLSDALTKATTTEGGALDPNECEELFRHRDGYDNSGAANCLLALVKLSQEITDPTGDAGLLRQITGKDANNEYTNLPAIPAPANQNAINETKKRKITEAINNLIDHPSEAHKSALNKRIYEEITKQQGALRFLARKKTHEQNNQAATDLKGRLEPRLTEIATDPAPPGRTERRFDTQGHVLVTTRHAAGDHEGKEHTLYNLDVVGHSKLEVDFIEAVVLPPPSEMNRIGKAWTYFIKNPTDPNAEVAFIESIVPEVFTGGPNKAALLNHLKNAHDLVGTIAPFPITPEQKQSAINWINLLKNRTGNDQVDFINAIVPGFFAGIANKAAFLNTLKEHPNLEHQINTLFPRMSHAKKALAITWIKFLKNKTDNHQVELINEIAPNIFTGALDRAARLHQLKTDPNLTATINALAITDAEKQLAITSITFLKNNPGRYTGGADQKKLAKATITFLNHPSRSSVPALQEEAEAHIYQIARAMELSLAHSAIPFTAEQWSEVRRNAAQKINATVLTKFREALTTAFNETNNTLDIAKLHEELDKARKDIATECKTELLNAIEEGFNNNVWFPAVVARPTLVRLYNNLDEYDYYRVLAGVPNPEGKKRGIYFYRDNWNIHALIVHNSELSECINISDHGLFNDLTNYWNPAHPGYNLDPIDVSVNPPQEVKDLINNNKKHTTVFDNKRLESIPALGKNTTYIRTDNSNHTATVISGTDETAHKEKQEGRDKLGFCTVDRYTYNIQMNPDGTPSITINPLKNQTVQARTPALPLVKENHIKAVKDVSEKLSYTYEELQKKLSGQGGADAVKHEGPMVYNLLLSLRGKVYDRVSDFWKPTLDQNLEHLRSARIHKGAHIFNKGQVAAGKINNLCYVQQVPVNQHGDHLTYSSSDANHREAALMTDMALLATLLANAHHLPSQAVDLLRKNYDYAHKNYIDFLKASEQGKLYFNESELGEKSIDKLKSMNVDIRKGCKILPTKKDNEPLEALITRALFKLMGTQTHHPKESEPFYAHRNKKYGAMIQSFSVFLEKMSLTGCKSGNERTAMILGRVEVLQALAQRNPGDTLKTEETDLITALNNFVNDTSTNPDNIQAALDKLYNNCNLQGSTNAITNLNTGPGKMKNSKDSKNGYIPESDTNVTEANAPYLHTKHATDLQVHKQDHISELKTKLEEKAAATPRVFIPVYHHHP